MEFLDRFWIGYAVGVSVTLYFWWRRYLETAKLITEATQKADKIHKRIKGG